MPNAAFKFEIVTFTPKDKRLDKKKNMVGIVYSGISSKVSLIDFGMTSPNAFLAPSLPDEEAGFDVNEYEAPIVIASLPDGEITALMKNPNGDKVVNGPVYAMGSSVSSGDVPIGRMR